MLPISLGIMVVAQTPARKKEPYVVSNCDLAKQLSPAYNTLTYRKPEGVCENACHLPCVQCVDKRHTNAQERYHTPCQQPRAPKCYLIERCLVGVCSPVAAEAATRRQPQTAPRGKFRVQSIAADFSVPSASTNTPLFPLQLQFISKTITGNTFSFSKNFCNL